jgi:hypothetical protein
MSYTFFRQELFDLVWFEPTRTIAKRLGISDVGLAKACRRADLLLPPRGYWAKLAAGKAVKKPKLPPRGPGMSDRIVLGRNRWSWGPDPVDLSTPDPPIPAFAETLEELAARLRTKIGSVRSTRDLKSAHPRIQKVLDADDQRRARQAASQYPTYDDPVFDTSVEKRRLRLLNSLMRALDRLNVAVSIDGREARELMARVADYSVSFTIDGISSKATSQSTQQKSVSGPMRCQIMALCGGDQPIESWTDVEGQPLETRLADIAVAIVVHGERVCRSSAQYYRDWVIKRKAEIAEEQRRKEEERQVTEFWKSAPSLLTFLDSRYALLRELNHDRTKVPRALLTSGDDISSLARRNHRISPVVDIALGPVDIPPRLWTAPTYTYYRDEFYEGSRPRKVLVFSGWRFVPKAIAIIASQAAAQRFGGDPKDPTQPLRLTDRKSFHVFDVCFPAPTLARLGGAAYVELRRDGLPGINDVVAAVVKSLRDRLEHIGVRVVDRGSDPAWQIVMRLELKDSGAPRIRRALDEWVSSDKEETSDAIIQHKQWAADWLAEGRPRLEISESRLQQLALVAAFSPANCVFRALESVYGAKEAEDAFSGIVALCLGSMRRYFNRPHVQQIVRQHRFRLRWREASDESEHGYAERALVYAGDAHLQAVLDEYIHLQRHAAQSETVEKAITQLDSVWKLARGTPRTNGASGSGDRVRIKLEAGKHTTHFALAFGEDESRDSGPNAGEEEKVRKSVVREAFNSPFWPFVLATTSVGQEGLDFHLYCRDVMHWNLPSNPVDLEQREGRINRRDCLAVRESIARDWPLTDPAMSGGDGSVRNPWSVVFDRIQESDDVQKYKHGLFPHWVYECRNPKNTVRIQRHVPFFTTSRDALKYEQLKTGLALYRLVFGQTNQEDLLQHLQQQIEHFEPDEREKVFRRLASYMLNLSPIGHAHALQYARAEADQLLAADRTSSGGLKKLVDSALRMLEDRSLELAEVRDEIRGLTAFVERSIGNSGLPSRVLLKAVAALAYLRNPYDRIFDLHVEGGFADDVEVIREASKAVDARR